MKKTALLLALLCAAPASAARFELVPGAWNGKTPASDSAFTLDFNSYFKDWDLRGDYIFSCGRHVVKGSFNGTRLRESVYALSILLPAGTALPEFGVLFPEPQYIKGTLDLSRANPELTAAFAAFPDMKLSARLEPSPDGRRFTARWTALGRGGSAAFKKAPTPGAAKRQAARRSKTPAKPAQ